MQNLKSNLHDCPLRKTLKMTPKNPLKELLQVEASPYWTRMCQKEASYAQQIESTWNAWSTEFYVNLWQNMQIFGPW